MAVLDGTQKMDIYESLSTINASFAGIVHHIQEIQQAGVITAKRNRLFSGFTRELQAGINSDILERLHEREMDDWFRFGKVRQAYEKQIRDPDDVVPSSRRTKKGTGQETQAKETMNELQPHQTRRKGGFLFGACVFSGGIGETKI